MHLTQPLLNIISEYAAVYKLRSWIDKDKINFGDLSLLHSFEKICNSNFGSINVRNVMFYGSINGMNMIRQKL